MYLVKRGSVDLVIPNHQCSATLNLAEVDEPVELDSLQLTSGEHRAEGSPVQSLSVVGSTTQVALGRPGMVELRAMGVLKGQESLPESVGLRLRLRPADCEHSVNLDCEFNGHLNGEYALLPSPAPLGD